MTTIPSATRPIDERCRRRYPGPSALLFAFCLSACSGGPPATPAKWTGTNGNLEVTLTLTISSDSLSGQGTYTAKTPEELRCGGEVLAQSGTVTLSGQVTSDGFGAHATFGSDWSAPYSGTFVGKDTIRGGFMSGEGGSCPLILVRQR
jgi:hypothetical protein